MDKSKIHYFESYGFWQCSEGFQTILIAWYMTFVLNLAPTDIGFYQALYLFPNLILIVAGGAITDRIGAYRSFTFSTGMLSAVLFGYALVIWLFGFSEEIFTAYCVFAGIATAISSPAIDTFILGETARETERNSITAAAVHNSSKLLGTVGGLALPFLSTIGGFVANGILLIFSIFFLSRYKTKTIKSSVNSHSYESHNNSLARSFTFGFKKILNHYRKCPLNFDIVLSSALQGLVVIPTGFILWPIVLRDKLPLHGDLIAWIYAAFWVGTIASSFTAHKLFFRIKWGGRVALGLWCFTGGTIYSLSIVTNFIELLFIVFLQGLLVGAAKPLVYGRYLENCPQFDKALFISVDQMAFWGFSAFGAMIVGALIDISSLSTTIQLNALFLVVGVIGLTLKGNLVRLKLHGIER